MNIQFTRFRLPALVLSSCLWLAACSDQDAGNKAETPLSGNTTPGSTDPGNASLTPAVVDVAEANCEASGSAQERLAHARAEAIKKHSPDSLACASLLYATLAEAQPADPDLAVEAMTVMEESLYFLRVIQTLDLMGVDKINTDRIANIGKAYHHLAESTYQVAAEDPRVVIHKGLAAREVDGVYDTALLQQAIEKQADALGGLAQVRLGRLLFELPSILGGDFQAAIALFGQAVEINPQNMQALYYLAEVYEQELEEEKAALSMARMLEVSPVDAQLQISTDMLRLAIGLSQRIGKAELSAQLEQKRQQLLSAHPELMTRVSIAVGGHGGVNPLTGE